MVTKGQRKVIEAAKERAGGDWDALMRDVRAKKVTVHDAMRLQDEGKHEEARVIFGALMEHGANQPTEIIMETGRPAVAKQRGKVVELDKEGKWQLKNPPKSQEPAKKP
jgi:hypothetical protein